MFTRQDQTSLFTGEMEPNEPAIFLLDKIKKNQLIPLTLTEIKDNNHADVEMLLKAIQSGNPDAKIFEHPNCDMFLLHLVIEKKIPFWHGMTAYVYLMSLMQYTDKQPLKQEDLDVKSKRKVNVTYISRDGQLTEEGKNYLNAICTRYAKVNIFLDRSEIEKFVLQLPPTEQWLLNIEVNTDNKSLNDNDELMWSLVRDIPSLQEVEVNKMEKYYVIPSYSMFNYILLQISPNPVKSHPMFGSIGEKTLFELHKNSEHPAPLHSNKVKSNIGSAGKGVHDYVNCGPFPALMHDWGHTVWGSILGQQRQILYSDFIPTLEKWRNEATHCNDMPLVARINHVISRVNDFDLTPLTNFPNPQKQLSKYLATCFEEEIRGGYLYYNDFMGTQKVEFAEIGQCIGDKLYFFLCREAHQNNSNNLWKNLLTEINTKTGPYYRNKNAIEILNTLAKNSVPAPDDSLFALVKNGTFSIKEIDRAALLKIVETAKSSEELWMTLIGSYENYHQLLTLIKNGLKFFHPLLPMTETKKQEFIHFLQNKKMEIETPKVGNNSQTEINGEKRPKSDSEHKINPPISSLTLGFLPPTKQIGQKPQQMSYMVFKKGFLA